MTADSDQKQALFELAVFLATSARGSIEEGVFTASFRLADALRRLILAFPDLAEGKYFEDLSEILGGRFRTAYHLSEAEYLKLLDEIVEHTAFEIRRRTGIDSGWPV